MKDRPLKDQALKAPAPAKFQDPKVTAKGDARAHVAFSGAKTLWFNTGTLCNITCAHCYIESSPTNDALEYLTLAEMVAFLDEAADLGWSMPEVAFTGGEPFMNPDMPEMARAALSRGYRVLILTNAMIPMQRPSVLKALRALNADFPGQMVLRVSLDHHTAALHDAERGAGAFERSLKGMDFLRDTGIHMAVAGRTVYGETLSQARAGFAALFAAQGYAIDAQNPARLVLFPEMDMDTDVPEITTDCWRILHKSPDDVMCASQRMVVKRKGAARPVVMACTLLAYDDRFVMGETLAAATKDVSLNHRHCAQFCVLGGASCSA